MRSPRIKLNAWPIYPVFLYNKKTHILYKVPTFKKLAISLPPFPGDTEYIYINILKI